MRKIPILVKDLAYGNIAPDRYGKFFTEYFVKDILLPELNRILIKHQTHYFALKEFYEVNKEGHVFGILQEDGDLVNAYTIAYTGFLAMRNNRGDLRYLNAISSQLRPFKFRL